MEKLIVILVVLIIIVFTVYGGDEPIATSESNDITTPIPRTVPETKVEEKVILQTVTYPANGTILEQSFSSVASDQESILKIETSGSEATIVKMEYNSTKEVLLIVFIKPGQSVELSIPAGTYIMKTGSGEKWYGSEIMFGEEGSYSQMDGLQIFQPYEVWTYQLFKQQGGNLGEQYIDQSDF